MVDVKGVAVDEVAVDAAAGLDLGDAVDARRERVGAGAAAGDDVHLEAGRPAIAGGVEQFVHGRFDRGPLFVLVLDAQGKKRSFVEKKVKSVLRVVGMEDRLTTLPPSLSGGEQQRVAVARAIAGDPKIILADEPTGSLDDDSAAVILRLLHLFHRRGATVVVATHDKSLIASATGRVVQIRQGRLEPPLDI